MKIHPLAKLAIMVGSFIFIFVVCLGGLLIYLLVKEFGYRKMTDTHDLEARVARMGRQYSTNHPSAGLVIAVYERGSNYLVSFGKSGLSGGAPPDGETMFEIGSITKALTGITLARMADDGLVKLDDPISLYLPKGVVVPKKNGDEITLLNLATHTAGLPRLPANIFVTAKDPQNPYVNYHSNDLYESLASVKLGAPPGTKLDYSNYGYGLLGHLLELKAGKPYEQLVIETICEPLGLSNTVITLSSDQNARLAPGHDPKGQPAGNWDFDVLAGCGAFRSTANDMMKFVQANLETNNSGLFQSMSEAREPHFGRLRGSVGLGWQITTTMEQTSLIWHNGGTGGYISFVGFDRTNQVGVVILANSGDATTSDNSVDLMGMEILRRARKVSWN